MRRRLVVTIVGAVAASLILAGLGTLLLAGIGARRHTENELRAQVESITDSLSTDDPLFPVGADRPRLLAALRAALQLEGVGLLTVAPDGTLMSVPVKSKGEELEIGKARRLFAVKLRRNSRLDAYQYDIASNLTPESLSGPNAGLTEVLVPAGYVTTVYDPVFTLSADKTRYVSKASDTPTTIPAPGLPFSLVFRAEPGREDVLLKIASAYEAASRRRIPPPAFGPIDVSKIG